jgi:uncharacterized protein YutE (UPF0331/DUF86 family)
MTDRVLQAKAEALQRCLARIRQTCPASHATVAEGVPPPTTMGESFDRLAEAGRLTPDLARRLRGAVGFRNIAVHAYDRIDWAVVHALATTRLGDLESLATALLPPPAAPA